MVNEGTITRIAASGGTNKSFLFKTFSMASCKKFQPVTQLPIVGQAPENNILFRFFGQQEEITFNFAIYNDGSDASGLGSAGIITVDQQIRYLRDEIYTAEFDTIWTIVQPRYYPSAVQCVITNLDFDNPAGGVDIVTGTITLVRGVVARLGNF
jgi:hypothetical protein